MSISIWNSSCSAIPRSPGRALRQDAYGFDLAPLPQNLQLHAEETTIQRMHQLDVNITALQGA